MKVESAFRGRENCCRLSLSIINNLSQTESVSSLTVHIFIYYAPFIYMHLGKNTTFITLYTNLQ